MNFPIWVCLLGEQPAARIPRQTALTLMTAMSRPHPKYNKALSQEHIPVLSHQILHLGLQQTRCPAFVRRDCAKPSRVRWFLTQLARFLPG